MGAFLVTERHVRRGERVVLADHTSFVETAARRIAEALVDVVRNRGMGTDGHTASLFPGSRALAERARRVVPVSARKPPPRRLTITPPVIAAARRVAVLVSGSEKAPAVAHVLAGPYQPWDLPIQLALHGVWFMDAAAATVWQERAP